MELLGASQSAGQFLVSNPDSAGSRTTYVKPPFDPKTLDLKVLDQNKNWVKKKVGQKYPSKEKVVGKKSKAPKLENWKGGLTFVVLETALCLHTLFARIQVWVRD